MNCSAFFEGCYSIFMQPVSTAAGLKCDQLLRVLSGLAAAEVSIKGAGT